MKLEWREWRASFAESALTTITTFVMACGGLAIAALSSELWLFGVLLGGLGLLRTFCFMHDLSHGAAFRSQRTNDILGVLASVLCLIPYFAWKRVHLDHHQWAGWRELDPTEGGDMRQAPEGVKRFARFVWRNWIPVLALIFAAATFWASKRQMQRAHSRREQRAILWGARFVVLCHLAVIVLAPAFYFGCYLPAALVYLFIMEPLTIAQHAEVPLRAPLADSKPIAHAEQEGFARTLRVPRWFGQHVILGFHMHSAHHAYPWIPGPKLDRVPRSWSVDEHWWTWLKRAKATPIDEVVGAHYAEGFAPSEQLVQSQQGRVMQISSGIKRANA